MLPAVSVGANKENPLCGEDNPLKLAVATVTCETAKQTSDEAVIDEKFVYPLPPLPMKTSTISGPVDNTPGKESVNPRPMGLPIREGVVEVPPCPPDVSPLLSPNLNGCPSPRVPKPFRSGSY